ncbi:hypothetical protein LSUE1_G010384, partial [Lachnellula suecica]
PSADDPLVQQQRPRIWLLLTAPSSPGCPFESSIHKHETAPGILQLFASYISRTKHFLFFHQQSQSRRHRPLDSSSTHSLLAHLERSINTIAKMGAGRFVCVALPFGLSLASLICILIAMLAGITNKNLDMFEVDTQNFSISSSELANLVSLTKRSPEPATGLGALTSAALSPSASLAEYEAAVLAGSNITATMLGLADSYKVSLWNYCATNGTNTTCTKAKFNWAADSTNTTTLLTTANEISGGTNVTLPKEMTSALKTFSVFTKWTQVVYIIAIILLGAELVVGIFGFCSRVGSCITSLICGLATTATIAASIMATAETSIVVGALKTAGKAYGLKSSINTSFLATTWLAVAFSIGAGLFWSLSSCCCAADHHKNGGNRRSVGDQEKLIPTGAYHRVDEPQHYNNGMQQQQTGVFNTGAPAHVRPQQANGAYEPYSHTAI